jgi:predicted AlkP superfamily pyrophosphatase or phosphodiesterase
MPRVRRSAFWVFCVTLVFAGSVWGQTRKDSGRPKLVVVLVVDQMRADYVDQFRHQWTGGLRRLLEHGAWFRQAAYPYLSTHTCVGHATIGTGTFPATHGIVDNAWWDRESGKVVTCTEDADATAVSYGPAARGGESARRLLMPTLAEELRAQTSGGARVVTISIKARSAIMLAGRRADAVTWHDDRTGAWVTSSAYGAVPFVEKYVKAHPMEADYGKTWSPALPEQAYLYADSAEGKKGPEGWGAMFPHVLRGLPTSDKPDAAFYRQWETSPFSDAYLGHLGQEAVNALGLGKGPGTDFLGISFSALDLVGHAYGPQSHEVQDVLVQLDRTLGGLFEYLDKMVGPDNYVVAFSADHGVVPIPEALARIGIDAGRIDRADLTARVEKALEPALGPGHHVARVSDADIYFAAGVYSKIADYPAAMQAVQQAIRSVPGVAQVFRSEEVRERPATGDPFARAAALSYFPGRSGDLIIVTRPYWIFDYVGKDGSSLVGTTHGSPYLYDQRVPLFLLGAGFKAGEYLEATSPADIAPTLAFLCGITLARSDGRVLTEVLVPPAAAVPLTIKPVPAKH